MNYVNLYYSVYVHYIALYIYISINELWNYPLSLLLDWETHALNKIKPAAAGPTVPQRGIRDMEEVELLLLNDSAPDQ